jgi:type III secretory pathway component EscV
MPHDAQNEIQKASLIGRILSIEAFLLVMGIASLVFGILKDLPMNIFWGIVIIPGVFILRKVRSKDWAKHWEEMEAEHKARAEFDARRKSAAEEARKNAHEDK